MKHTIDEALARFDLIAGTGSEGDKKACAMTLLAWVAGQDWTDSPPCVHPIIRRAVIHVNDASDTTPEMRAEIVCAGEHGILDTWWVPTPVVVQAFALESKGEEITEYARLLRALGRVAGWKADKGLPPDLSGADLRGADLSGAYLSGADLRGADLSGAYLRSADLRSAVLRSTVLRGAVLSGADLRGAVLRSADLRSADLRSAYGTPYEGMPDGWKLNGRGRWVRS